MVGRLEHSEQEVERGTELDGGGKPGQAYSTVAHMAGSWWSSV